MINGKNLKQWWEEYNGQHGAHLKPEIKCGEGEYSVAPASEPESPTINDDNKINPLPLPPSYFFVYYVQNQEDARHKDYFWSIAKDLITNRIYLILRDKRGVETYGSIVSAMERPPLPLQRNGILEKDLQWADFLSKFMIKFYIFGESEEKILSKFGEEVVEVPEEEIEKYMKRLEDVEKQKAVQEPKKEYTKEQLDAILDALMNRKIEANPGQTIVPIEQLMAKLNKE